MLIENSHDNKAVFVVRYHSGTNIGPGRFAIIKNLAESSIKTIPEGLNQRLLREGAIKNNHFSLHVQPQQPQQQQHHPKQQMQPSVDRTKGQWQRGGLVAQKVLTYNELATPPPNAVQTACG